MFALVLALVPGAAEDPVVVVSPADERVVGNLVRFTPDLTATVITAVGEVTVKDVLSVRRVNRRLPPFPTGPQLLTPGGDRVAGKLRGGTRATLTYTPSGIPIREVDAWSVRLSQLSAVWLTDLPADTPPDPARYGWVEGTTNRDILRLRSGDTPTGVVLGVEGEADAPALRFRGDIGGERQESLKDVSAIVFNPTLARFRKPKGAYARVVLADGSRLNLTNLTVGDDILRGDTLFGPKVAVPWGSVVSLDVLQGKAVYLSDLKPKAAEHAGYLGAGWEWAADRTVMGDPLRLGPPGRPATFDKGIGTHPRTVLAYDLGGKYRRFDARIGLDPETGDRGAAVVRIKVDGKERPLPGLSPLTAGEPVPVALDVTDAKELTLEVDFGPAGGVRAVVNWGDPRLVEAE